MSETIDKHSSVPIIGIVGYSGSGKTTVLRRLVSELNATGIRTAVIKHAHHTFDIDTPGKDSYVLRQAGATQTIVASRNRWALMVETPNARQEPLLADLIAQLDLAQLDVVFVEGFKHAHYSKIEIHRAELNKPLLYPEDPDIIALITNRPSAAIPAAISAALAHRKIPLIDINNSEQIFHFIMSILGCRND